MASLEGAEKRVRKLLWRLRHLENSETVPVFVLGAQRSGTSMLMRCLDMAPELECFTEARQSRAFRDFRLNEIGTVKKLIDQSVYEFVIFKPLADSHRALELLELRTNAKALWVYRHYSDRANSAVAKFGDHNLEILSAFSRGELLGEWQAQCISAESFELLRRFDYESMSPESAAALFWFIRNQIYFELNLMANNDVLPINYENFVRNPERTMQAICRFIGLGYDDRLIRIVHGGSVGKRPSNVSDDVAVLCDSLYSRLDTEAQRRRSNF